MYGKLRTTVVRNHTTWRHNERPNSNRQRLVMLSPGVLNSVVQVLALDPLKYMYFFQTATNVDTSRSLNMDDALENSS